MFVCASCTRTWCGECDPWADEDYFGEQFCYSCSSCNKFFCGRCQPGYGREEALVGWDSGGSAPCEMAYYCSTCRPKYHPSECEEEDDDDEDDEESE